MIINDYFIESYLTPGVTYDNFIFENCPLDFVKIAKEKLSEQNHGVKSCCVMLTREIEELVEKILDCCSEEIQKKLLARDFVTAMIMRELLQDVPSKHDDYDRARAQLNVFKSMNFEKAKELHSQCFMPYDVRRLKKEVGAFEINFFLIDTQNRYLQQAINVFVSSREPYSVKIYTNNRKLPSYWDLEGNAIECPHDFMRRNVYDYIYENNTKEQ